MSDDLLVKIEDYFARAKTLRETYHSKFPQALASHLVHHLTRTLAPKLIDWELIVLGGSVTVCPENNWLKRLLRKL